MDFKEIIQLLKSKDPDIKLKGCKNFIVWIRNDQKLSNPQISFFIKLLTAILRIDLPNSELTVESLSGVLQLLSKGARVNINTIQDLLFSIEEKYVQSKNENIALHKSFVPLTIQTILSLIRIYGAKQTFLFVRHWVKPKAHPQLKIVVITCSYQQILTNLSNYPLLEMVPSIAKLVSDKNTKVKANAISSMKEMFSLFGEPFQELLQYILNPKEFEAVKSLLEEVVVVSKNNRAELNIDFSQLQEQQQKKQFQTKRYITPKKKYSTSPKKDQNAFINSYEKSNSKNEFSSSTELKSHINKNSKKMLPFQMKKSLMPSNWKALSDKIPEKLISDEDHLEKELDKIYKDLTENEGEDWVPRMEAMIRFESLLNGNAADYEILYTKIQNFHDPFLVQLRDLRSKINKQICYLIAHLSRRLKDRFHQMIECLLNDLLRLVDQKKKVMAESGDFCIKISIHNTRAPKCILILYGVISKTKSTVLRFKCTEYLLLMLGLWETSILEKYCTAIEKILSLTIDGLDPGTRKSGRLAFWRYAQHFTDNARIFYNKLQINTQKNLNKEKDPELNFLNFGKQVNEPVVKEVNKNLLHSIREYSKNKPQRRINRKSPIKKINRKSSNQKLIQINSNKFKEQNNHKHEHINNINNHNHNHNHNHNRYKNNNSHQNNHTQKRSSTRKERRSVDSHLNNKNSRRQRNSSGQGQRKKFISPTKSYTAKDHLARNRYSISPVRRMKSLKKKNQQSKNIRKKKSKILSKTISSLIMQLENNPDLDLKESLLISIKKKLLNSTTTFQNNKLFEKLIICILKQLQLNEIAIIQITLDILKILIISEKKIFKQYRKMVLQYLIPIIHLNEKLSSMVIVFMKMIQHSYGDLANVLIMIINQIESKYQIFGLALILNKLQQLGDNWFKNEKNIKLIMNNILPILDKNEKDLIERAKTILKFCYEKNQVSFFQQVLLLPNSKTLLLKDAFSLILPTFNEKFEEFKINKKNNNQMKNEKKKSKKTNKKPKKRILSKSSSLPSIQNPEVFFLIKNFQQIRKKDNKKPSNNSRDGNKIKLEPKNGFISKQETKANENTNKREIKEEANNNNTDHQEEKKSKIEEDKTGKEVEKIEKVGKVEKTEPEFEKMQVKQNNLNNSKENTISKKQLNTKEIKKNKKLSDQKIKKKKLIIREKHNQKSSINKKQILKRKPSPQNKKTPTRKTPTKKTPNSTNKNSVSPKKRILLNKKKKKHQKK
ncbi:clasp [Anaeramoeba flamelloides]|uniref:Clasp n=1 Tax=Anaeramoeba flamelloides TaxID=1746091 RepID=A0AAV8A1T0_9EUKA|nr:clasp [Anaeramoeba flamelloides]